MGEVNADENNTKESDWSAFSESFISVTPLTIDMTDYKAYKEYKNN